MTSNLNRLFCLQHVPFEGPGMIADWCVERQIELVRIAVWKDTLPDLQADDGVCLMGGPMSIHDESDYPWMAEEKAWLKNAIARHTPILGVCLGAQLLANVFGAGVYPNEVKEIGWMPVAWTHSARKRLPSLPAGLEVLHWHGETFDLPEGAVHLAESDHCRNQAFLLKSVLALQFHLEMGPDECETITGACANELIPSSKTVHSASEILDKGMSGSEKTRPVLFALLDHHFRPEK